MIKPNRSFFDKAETVDEAAAVNESIHSHSMECPREVAIEKGTMKTPAVVELEID